MLSIHHGNQDYQYQLMLYIMGMYYSHGQAILTDTAHRKYGCTRSELLDLDNYHGRLDKFHQQLESAPLMALYQKTVRINLIKFDA